MSARRHLAAAFAALTFVAFAPVASAAVTVAIDRSCYSHVPGQGTQPIVATITGGTPGANFLLSASDPGEGRGSAGSASGTFDAAGNAVAQLTNVFPPSGSIGPLRGQPVNLSLTDYGSGQTDVPVGRAVITNLALDVASKPRSPREPRRVRVSGTPFAGKRLFGFVTKPGSSRVLRRFALGKANRCGFATSKEIVAPRSFASGEYRLYVNAGRKLRKPLALAYSFRLTKI